MKKRYSEFQRVGCEVVAISFAQSEAVSAFLAESPMPFPVLSDPSRTAYSALGLARTSWQSMLRPSVVGRYLKLMLRGWLPRQPGKDQDVMQLGGDFVLDGQRRLVFAYRSAEPTDRPSVDRLLEVVPLAE